MGQIFYDETAIKTLITDLAFDADKKVLIFSFGMTAEQLIRKIVDFRLGQPLRLRKCYFTSEDILSIEKVFNGKGLSNIIISDVIHPTLEYMRIFSHFAKTEHKEIGMVVIIGPQYVEPQYVERKLRTFSQRFETETKVLHVIGNEFECPIGVLQRWSN